MSSIEVTKNIRDVCAEKNVAKFSFKVPLEIKYSDGFKRQSEKMPHFLDVCTIDSSNPDWGIFKLFPASIVEVQGSNIPHSVYGPNDSFFFKTSKRELFLEVTTLIKDRITPALSKRYSTFPRNSSDPTIEIQTGLRVDFFSRRNLPSSMRNSYEKKDHVNLTTTTQKVVLLYDTHESPATFQSATTVESSSQASI